MMNIWCADSKDSGSAGRQHFKGIDIKCVPGDIEHSENVDWYINLMNISWFLIHMLRLEKVR